MWVYLDIDIIKASYLPFNRTLGDHWLVMVDLTMSSVHGKKLKDIVPHMHARQIVLKGKMRPTGMY